MDEQLYKELVIDSIRVEADEVKTFYLSLKDKSLPPLTYHSGQFLTFAFQHHNREERRSFSISSSPVTDEQLAVTIKRVENGAYSRLLIDRAAAGDTLYTTGAGGLFTLPDNINDYEQIFLFAAGIGITPIFSLIKDLLYNFSSIQVVLIYSNRTIDDTVFYKELNQLKQQSNKRFKIEFLYSTSFDLKRARLNKELLPFLLRQYASRPLNNTLFYTCGPFDYMRMVIITLEEQGIKNAQIKRENFNPNSTPVKKTEPVDKGSYQVHLKYAGKAYSFLTSYPDTILQAAKKNNINLPYSCEAGKCGSCAALCTKGAVWLSYNEVLMPDDLAKGKVLTCVGHPVGGDVFLEM